MMKREIFKSLRMEKFPNILPTCHPALPFKDLEFRTWVAIASSEGYCTGYLINRLSDDKVVITPYWDEGVEYDSSTHQLKDSGVKRIQLAEVENDYWYAIIHEQGLMCSQYFKDCHWSELTMGELVELNLELHQLSLDNELPKGMEWVFDFISTEHSDDYICQIEVDELYHRVYYKY